ncbi:pentatricopeptide repeat-containing protein At4g30825, chloroplastic [Gastrolobium bilobum]|uniref:pentatricopeptide repeat-containing protein At4g30825, chloroplastic n=1 Tax=Gastrolobium bilobum TaxID=150636 RepID=UPI002AAF8070|nr:pentatricopeptide repeat-containing protein At4g30825, chloroplastic [Gastrolobium bilobum]
MASLGFSISLDFAFDSKPSLPSLSLSTSTSTSTSIHPHPKTKLGIPVAEANPNSNPQVRSTKKAPKTSRDLKFSYATKSNVPLNTEKLFTHGADVDFSSVGVELSAQHCNAILKRLAEEEESASDGAKTLSFFEWMRKTGKLERNAGAYTVAARALSRRGDWEAAEKLVREMRDKFGSELSFHVFNTLIYACSKRGLVQLGAKWFRTMLSFGVVPNVATFGMLMTLCQKGWNVEEAEFAISQMREHKIICESAYSSMITIYTRFGLYKKAEGVIEMMKSDEVVPNLENWLVMLNAYSQQGKLEDAERVLFTMQEAGFCPNIVAYNTMITGYGKASNMDAAQRMFLCMQFRVGLYPDETTYRSMIEGWGRADNYEQARWYYKELKRLGYKPNSSNLYTLIKLEAKHGDHEDGAVGIIILDDMVDIGCQYSSIIGTLLHVYERAGKVHKVPVLLKGSFYRHVLVNQSSCSTLVMAYVKHQLVEDAIKVLNDKKWKDPHYEDNLYHLLICSCKEAGLMEDAVKIFSQMPKSDDKPNMHIMCTMIDIYSVMGLFNDAEVLYLKLKSSGISLDMIAFSIVVRMYVKAGSLKDACSVLDAIDKRPDIVLDNFLLRDMLRIYQRCNMVDKLADMYYKISKDRASWDQELYNCVLDCCAQALPVDELSRLFDEILQRGFAPNTVSFNVMLNVFGKAKLFKKVRRFFCMAKKQGLADVISYNTIIAAYGKNKDFKNMSSMVQKMQFDGFSVSLEAYNSMLDAYGKDGQMETFRSVLQKMKESNCDSDHYTYNTMINIYGEQGWIEEVANVLTELKECGLGPDLHSYNTLIKAYGIAGMVEEAVGLIKEMRKNGIEPDKKTYTNLITALRRNDKFLEAVKWSLWMKQLKL